MAAVQAAAYGSAQPVLTPALWKSVLDRKLFEHQERRAFRCAARAALLSFLGKTPRGALAVQPGARPTTARGRRKGDAGAVF